MSCKHRRFWILRLYAWCPECGAIRLLQYTPNNEALEFAWKRWIVPGDVDRALKLLDKNKKTNG